MPLKMIVGETDSFACPFRATNCRGKNCVAWLFDEGQEEIKQGFVPCNEADSKANVEPHSSRIPKEVPGSWVFIPAHKSDNGNAGWEEPYHEASDRRVGLCMAIWGNLVGWPPGIQL